ncbi:hypothetical protein ACQJBY_015798 [Aegilops geniculata]
MADTVQYRLERMSDELDDLERRGLFTRAELAEVVRRRRDFEFRLRRHSPRKADFLDYIAYLLRVDALRDLRKRAIIRATPNPTDSDEDNDTNEDGKKRKKRKKKWAKSISDFAGVLRVLDVYRMATVRFKGDLDLWFRYLDFCRQKGHGRMKQVMAQAIRYHPKVPGLWMYAAAWEFDQNLNVAAARALMQSGLRSCPESEDMWIEYLRMELTYLNKLKARKVALGEDVKTLQKSSDDSGQWKEENKELFMSLDEQGDSPKESGLEDVALEDKEDLFWQQGVLIIRTIYHGAMEALPSSLTLRKKILEILNSVELAHSEELRLEVMDDLKKDFSHNEDYWDWLARLQLSDSINSSTLNKKEAVLNKLNKSIQAMKLFSHEKIYFEKLVKCAMLSLSSAGGSDCGASVSSAFVGWVLQKDGIKQARKMYKRFLALPRPSLKFFQFCIELEANLASVGNNDGLVNARKLYDSAISIYPQERELWRKYYNMELTAGTSETSNAIYWRARKVLNDSTALDVPRS